MNRPLLIRLFFCIFVFSLFLYLYLQSQNEITNLRLQIPKYQKDLEMICQENTRLQFEIDQFENPINLMNLARKPEYSHLKHPLIKDIIQVPLPSCENMNRL